MSQVECPNCKTSFEARPRATTRRSLYPPEVEEAAGDLLAKIRQAASACDEGVKQCALFHLEGEWLRGAGHKVTIKLGANDSVNDATCSVCGRDTTHAGFAVHFVSRWRSTTTVIYLCDEHKGTPHLHETDVDIHRDNICPRVGYA